MTHSLERRVVGNLSVLTGGKGEPFVLLHGIPGSAFSWEKAGESLAAHYQVVVPDLLGFGQSNRPQHDYYMETQARAVKQMLDQLGITRLYLGGHDFGGPVAITLMRLFPELTIKGLVLSATNMFVDTYVPPPLRLARVPVFGWLVYKLMVGNRLGLWITYQFAARRKRELSWAQFNRHLTPDGIDYTRRIFQRSLADLPRNYRAVQDTLPNITCLTLILWGANDPFFAPTVAEQTRQALPQATLKIYTGTGHFVSEEQPGQVAQDIIESFASKGVA
jgi:pimeloyl-ACP methyl ester carboxylesterase